MLYPTNREHHRPVPRDDAAGACGAHWAVAGIVVAVVAAIAIAINIGNSTLPAVVNPPLHYTDGIEDRTCHNDGVGTACAPRPDDPAIVFQH